MQWIILIVLIGAVYWLFTNGYVNLESSVQYITSAIMEVVNSIAALLKGLFR